MTEKDNSPASQTVKAVSRLLAAGSTGVLITLIDGSGNVGAKLLVDDNGLTVGSLDNAALEAELIAPARLFLASQQETRMIKVSDFAPDSQFREMLLLFERIRPEPRLVICGAGHVGAALATMASLVGYSVTLIDDRAEFLERDRFSQVNVEPMLARDWMSAVRDAIADGRGVAVAVVTRGHHQDEECMRAVVKANPDYVGLIGSKRRTTIVIDRLREEGAPEELLKKIHAPIGLDIGAVSPEEVALAILAEIVGERRGGRGGSLSEWRRR